MENEGMEFFKLDNTDKKVLFWMMDNDRDSIASWAKEVARQYAIGKSVHIDQEKLLSEIGLELEPAENTPFQGDLSKSK